jgi:hypothetical protein
MTWILIGLSGCSLGTAPAPPTRPALPAIRYVPACDPQAVAGLTKEAVEGLRQRDQMWQHHVEQLEQQLGSRSSDFSFR